MTRTTAIAASILAVALLSLGVTGQLAPWPSPDTPTYLAAARSATPLAELRLPVYGWLAAPLLASAAPGWLLPGLQVGAFMAASLWLVVVLRRHFLSGPAAVAMAVALAGSNELLVWGHALLPEVPGHAALLAALALVLEIAAGRRAVWRVLWAALAATLAWALRPSLLPFILLLPLLVLLLPRPATLRVHGRAAWLLVALLLPFLTLSGLRAIRYHDFNVVSFNGFQMSGVAALMLTPDIADRLPPAHQDLARQIIARRDTLIAAGQALPIPLNSSGQRSFVSAAALYFDVLARSFDVVVWEGVSPLRQADESWPAFTLRLQALSLATFRAAPAYYSAWVAGATGRAVGHMLVLNPIFVLACTVLFGMVLWRGLRGASAPEPDSAGRRDIPPLLALTGVYLLGTAVPIVLVTMPAARYTDSACLFLAAWPVYGTLRLLRRS
ncbi:hypothetical protein [Limobrevibacterium gyesilva]|uniref:Uncharacterized protein n=1 Tax=Limobrevibacterium gyesilva TaxID=2991712 RepID=A0AA41YH70_9PROT|nr:hypothetical protein [Limobrevibacterium gyesilva]MCW3473144.1 hypothetical protein [Limobrevibacterium gyesilva]